MNTYLSMCFYACMHACMYVCMYVCMHGWMDGCMDGWMDGWMDKKNACMFIVLLFWNIASLVNQFGMVNLSPTSTRSTIPNSTGTDSYLLKI